AQRPSKASFITNSLLSLTTRALHPLHSHLLRRPGSRQLCPPDRLRERSREIRIKFPPVQTDGLRLIYAAYEQANPDREQLHVRQRNTNVARNNKAFVEHSVKNVEQIGCSGDGRRSLHEMSGKDRSGCGESARDLLSRILISPMKPVNLCRFKQLRHSPANSPVGTKLLLAPMQAAPSKVGQLNANIFSPRALPLSIQKVPQRAELKV